MAAHGQAREARDVRVARVYSPREPGGGPRVLVDRLWPRGLTKQAADIDVWSRAVAPSAPLRTWYGHDPDRFAEFGRRYRAELADAPAAVALGELVELAAAGPLTLVTASKAVQISQATVLAQLLGEPAG